MKKARLFGLLSAAVLTLTSIPLLNVSAADDYRIGTTSDGYDYELWNQNYTGTVSWDGETTSGGGFYCKWDNIENILFRKGKKLGSTKSYKEYGGVTVDYEVEYTPKGNSYMCIYGWVENCKGQYPTVEYYIVDAWGDWRPPGSNDSLGQFTSDGKTYDIYRTVRDMQPSIHGTETFYQYWSVRTTNSATAYQTKTIDGRITVSNHFAEWEKAGLDMSGQMYEVSLNIEGYRSSGEANVKKNVLQMGVSTDPPGSTTPDPEPDVDFTVPTGSGSGVTDDFEGSGTDWSGRGDVTVGLTSDFAHGGSKSLYVTGRTDSWNGFTIASDSELKAGQDYSISAFTAYKNDSYSSQGFTLGLQYDLNGQTQYDNLVDATASSGKWAELATDFSIPAGATAISLYVQTAYTENPTAADMMSFYLDDVVLTAAGAQETTTEEPVTTTTTPAPVTTTEAVFTTTVASVTTTAITTTPAPAVWTTTTTQTEAKLSLLGDTNCSGIVDISDAVLLARYLAEDKGASISDVGKLNADVNKNSTPDFEDVVMIIQYIAHLIKF